MYKYLLALFLVAFPSLGNAQVRAQVLLCDTSTQVHDLLRLALAEGIEEKEALDAVNKDGTVCGVLPVVMTVNRLVETKDYGGRDYEVHEVTVLIVLGFPPIEPFVQYTARLAPKQGTKL